MALVGAPSVDLESLEEVAAEKVVSSEEEHATRLLSLLQNPAALPLAVPATGDARAGLSGLLELGGAGGDNPGSSAMGFPACALLVARCKSSPDAWFVYQALQYRTTLQRFGLMEEFSEPHVATSGSTAHFLLKGPRKGKQQALKGLIQGQICFGGPGSGTLYPLPQHAQGTGVGMLKVSGSVKDPSGYPHISIARWRAVKLLVELGGKPRRTPKQGEHFEDDASAGGVDVLIATQSAYKRHRPGPRAVAAEEADGVDGRVSAAEQRATAAEARAALAEAKAAAAEVRAAAAEAAASEAQLGEAAAKAELAALRAAGSGAS